MRFRRLTCGGHALLLAVRRRRATAAARAESAARPAPLPPRVQPDHTATNDGAAARAGGLERSGSIRRPPPRSTRLVPAT